MAALPASNTKPTAALAVYTVLWFSLLYPASLVHETRNITNVQIKLKKGDEQAGWGTCQTGIQYGKSTHMVNTGRWTVTYPSAWGQSRLGPRTMAMLLGVILFTACCSDSRDKNWIRYLTGNKRKTQSRLGERSEWKKTQDVREDLHSWMLHVLRRL